MTARSAPPIPTEMLAAYLEGELSGSEHARVEAQLGDDADARQRLAQLGRIRAAMRAPVAELAEIDLVGRVREGLKKPEIRAGHGSRWVWAGGVAAAAAIALLFAWRPLHPEFQPRSAGIDTPDSQRWASFQVYRVRRGAESEPLGEQLSPGDGLLFAYSNAGPQPFDYVMIFAVGAHGQVHWFYPAYQQLGENPTSVPLQRGRTNVVLNEVVRHGYAPGPLSIYALFTRRPFGVLEVEAWLEQQRGAPTLRPPIEDATLRHFSVKVEP
jgi:hypothetical protein